MSTLRSFVAALLLASLTALIPAPAAAQVTDLSTITCKEFIEGEKDAIGYIMMWLDGYFTDEKAPPVVDFGKMKGKGEQLGKFCAANPGIGLITAAEPIMSVR